MSKPPLLHAILEGTDPVSYVRNEVLDAWFCTDQVVVNVAMATTQSSTLAQIIAGFPSLGELMHLRFLEYRGDGWLGQLHLERREGKMWWQRVLQVRKDIAETEVCDFGRGELGYLASQSGMFSLLPLTLQQETALTQRQGIHVVQGGRVNVARLGEGESRTSSVLFKT